MNTTTMPHMGKKLSLRLAELNMTLEDLGRKICMTKQGIHRLTTVESFHSKTTYKVAKALGVPVSYFFEE